MDENLAITKYYKYYMQIQFIDILANFPSSKKKKKKRKAIIKNCFGNKLNKTTNQYANSQNHDRALSTFDRNSELKTLQFLVLNQIAQGYNKTFLKGHKSKDASIFFLFSIYKKTQCNVCPVTNILASTKQLLF